MGEVIDYNNAIVWEERERGGRRSDEKRRGGGRCGGMARTGNREKREDVVSRIV